MSSEQCCSRKFPSLQGNRLRLRLKKRAERKQMTSEKFPVVCLGGSAGAVEAIRGLLRALPPEPGLAVVVVQHRRGPSVLADVLSASSSMRVQLIAEGMPLERDRVYVIPPNC